MEFCSRFLGMWRTENTEKYVFDKQGLFPSPTASPNNFTLLVYFVPKPLHQTIF
jgi:hypothetical protein